MTRRSLHAAPPLALAALLAAACSTVPEVAHPRPTLPVAPELAAHYALPGPVEEVVRYPIGGEDDRRFWRARLRCGDELAEVTYLEPAAGTADPGKPAVLLLPILAGGKPLMWILASDFADRGYPVAWAHRVASALKEGQRGPELDDLLRRTVVHNRMLYRWLREQPAVDGAPVGVLGVSMGGKVASAMLALEPEIAGAVMVMSGADLPSLAAVSSESRVERWRRWRLRADGLDGPGLEAELARTVRFDPLRFGAAVPTEKVFLVTTTADSVVPRGHQDLLWEAFGRPRRMLVPLGHYSAALALPGILSAASDFLDGRFAAVRAARPAR